MKKELKDYLHLHLGSKVEIEIHGKLYEGIFKGINADYFFVQVEGDRMQTPHRDFLKVKLLLRPLSDMSEEEAWEFIGGKSTLYDDVKMTSRDKNGIEVSYIIDAGDEGSYPQVHRRDFHAMTPKEFTWLLSRGFDLFGLIESGLALDKSTIFKR